MFPHNKINPLNLIFLLCHFLYLVTLVHIFAVLLRHLAAPCENVSLDICGQRRSRSACATLQSDQGLHCRLREWLDTTQCMNGEQSPADTLCICRIIWYGAWSKTLDGADFEVQLELLAFWNFEVVETVKACLTIYLFYQFLHDLLWGKNKCIVSSMVSTRVQLFVGFDFYAVWYILKWYLGG